MKKRLQLQIQNKTNVPTSLRTKVSGIPTRWTDHEMSNYLTSFELNKISMRNKKQAGNTFLLTISKRENK